MFGKSPLTFKPDSRILTFFLSEVLYHVLSLSCLKTLGNKQAEANLRYYYSDSLCLVHVLISPYQLLYGIIY
jgi:hypothetical protein